jgi:hypothetical protein
MTIYKLDNVFSESEVDLINSLLLKDEVPVDEHGNYLSYKNTGGVGINEDLGRLQYNLKPSLKFDNIKLNLQKTVNKMFNVDLTSSGVYCSEYSGKYGKPNLPVHWDHDTNDIIFNYQLSSNTSWDLGVDKTTYSLEDNSAVVFNPNKYTHWRPHKTFRDDQYIKMLFFRFQDRNNPSDYSHLDYTINHEIFKEIEEYRNSLGNS